MKTLTPEQKKARRDRKEKMRIQAREGRELGAKIAHENKLERLRKQVLERTRLKEERVAKDKEYFKAGAERQAKRNAFHKAERQRIKEAADKKEIEEFIKRNRLSEEDIVIKNEKGEFVINPEDGHDDPPPPPEPKIEDN